MPISAATLKTTTAASQMTVDLTKMIDPDTVATPLLVKITGVGLATTATVTMTMTDQGTTIKTPNGMDSSVDGEDFKNAPMSVPPRLSSRPLESKAASGLPPLRH